MNKVDRYLQIVEEAEATPDWTAAHDELLNEADDLWNAMYDEQRLQILRTKYDEGSARS